MKKIAFNILISLIFLNISLVSILFIPNSFSYSEEIDSKYGESPTIDGYINTSTQEWNTAKKIQVLLDDLPINLWVMNDDKYLYISVQLDLEPAAHNSSEFVGVKLSNTTSENSDDFMDAKIIQFSNISEGKFQYFDLYINDNIFINDTLSSGYGAAKLEGITSTYEFSIPINEINKSNEDAILEHGKTSAFMIIYGVSPYYPSGVRKSIIILINIEPISTKTPQFINATLFFLVITIFCILGAFYSFYIYKIFRLKDKIERIKR